MPTNIDEESSKKTDSTTKPKKKLNKLLPWNKNNDGPETDAKKRYQKGTLKKRKKLDTIAETAQATSEGHQETESETPSYLDPEEITKTSPNAMHIKEKEAADKDEEKLQTEIEPKPKDKPKQDSGTKPKHRHNSENKSKTDLEPEINARAETTESDQEDNPKINEKRKPETNDNSENNEPKQNTESKPDKADTNKTTLRNHSIPDNTVKESNDKIDKQLKRYQKKLMEGLHKMAAMWDDNSSKEALQNITSKSTFQRNLKQSTLKKNKHSISVDDYSNLSGGSNELWSSPSPASNFDGFSEALFGSAGYPIKTPPQVTPGFLFEPVSKSHNLNTSAIPQERRNLPKRTQSCPDMAKDNEWKVSPEFLRNRLVLELDNAVYQAYLLRKEYVVRTKLRVMFRLLKPQYQTEGDGFPDKVRPLKTTRTHSLGDIVPVTFIYEMEALAKEQMCEVCHMEQQNDNDWWVTRDLDCFGFCKIRILLWQRSRPRGYASSQKKIVVPPPSQETVVKKRDFPTSFVNGFRKIFKLKTT